MSLPRLDTAGAGLFQGHSVNASSGRLMESTPLTPSMT